MSSLRGSPIPRIRVKVQEEGKIKDIREIIVRITGLPTCLNGQIVDFGSDVKGIIMGFDEEDVLVLVLGDRTKLRLGGNVTGVSEPFKIPVGEAFLGRVITALGIPCDDRGDIEADDFLPVLRESAPIIARSPVNDFLPTGTKVIDMLVPLAKGQRQLILGDRITGKTVLAVDAILRQKDTGVLCIYCCVGKSLSALERVVNSLQRTGALSYTAVVAATDNAPVGEQYLVPFSAASLGDHLAGKGKDVLIVFDDMTKHAWAYRQLSLLLERPPGREAYPGDIFYVQTQLMERAGKFNEQHGGGSSTYIGIAETLQGDLTGYIPSNLVSICDGQICMSSGAFSEGMRPAVDVGQSLSIIGGRVQPPILKELCQNLRSDYARYVEVAQLSRLQSGLSGEATKFMQRAKGILAIFSQGENVPVTLGEEVLLLYALDKGHLTDLSDEDKKRFCREIPVFATARHEELFKEIEREGVMTPSIRRGLEDVLSAYFSEAGAE